MLDSEHQNRLCNSFAGLDLARVSFLLVHYASYISLMPSTDNSSLCATSCGIGYPTACYHHSSRGQMDPSLQFKLFQD
jgi:hypothetical protein